ncbi:hypothetical protein RJ40_01510 [Methanofollis aquaemaris]|uniref:Uncharacterized protein n=1 Tax=Methanofollis aquaemaris TaxID=126734 RepID=A0A8A3S1A8_9EURY|nr:hypothetical protein [Methanofollis aquaemaris]QSZ66267.1 hypothetical protein RJ40_01510 [Methanofollis aquaemaris]
MISTLLRVRVLEIEPNSLYEGESYDELVTVEMLDGTRLELISWFVKCPLSMLWKWVAVEIESSIDMGIEKIPEVVPRILTDTRGSSSFEVWGTLVHIGTMQNGIYEGSHGIVNSGPDAIMIDLPEKDQDHFHEGDHLHLQIGRGDLVSIHELTDPRSDAIQSDVDIGDLLEKGNGAPFALEFFIDEENLSPKNYLVDTSDIESIPWDAWLRQRGSFSLKIDDVPVFGGETDTSGDHFIETSLFSLLGRFVQSGLELLDGKTVTIWSGSLSCPHLVLKPCGRGLVQISVQESDAVVMQETAMPVRDYVEVVVDAVDRYLWQVLEIHPHVSRTPYPRVLADRRNEVMVRCSGQGILPGDGQILDYDALVDRAWRAYRPVLPPTPDGEVSHLSFGVTLTEGKTPENALSRFSLSVDGEVLFDDIFYEELFWATIFVEGPLFAVAECLEWKAFPIDLTTPGQRTITLTPGEDGTILFSLDNWYLPGTDARDIRFRLEDWIEELFAMVETYIALVGTSPLWIESSSMNYPLIPHLEECREKYRRYLEGRGGEHS